MDELSHVLVIEISVSTYSDDFSADIGECSLGHNSPPTQELSGVTSDAIVLDKWSRIFPVAETKPVVVGATAKIKNDAKDLFINDEAQD